HLASRATSPAPRRRGHFQRCNLPRYGGRQVRSPADDLDSRWLGRGRRGMGVGPGPSDALEHCGDALPASDAHGHQRIPPASALPTSLAIGSCPAAAATAASASTKKAAPSLMPEALPAVTEPSFLNAGFILARISRVVLVFTCSSVSKTTSPFFVCFTIGTICDLNRPSAIADAARRCDSTASASCSSRVMPHLVTRFSAVTPMWPTPNGSVSVA